MCRLPLLLETLVEFVRNVKFAVMFITKRLFEIEKSLFSTESAMC